MIHIMQPSIILVQVRIKVRVPSESVIIQNIE